jgi:putative hemolysin
MYVFVVVLLVLFNGLFAMAEIAVVSSNKFRLQQRAQAGSGSARRALTLAQNPNRFLSTVQIGITLVGVFAGAFGGATLAAPLAVLLERVSWLAPYSSTVALTLVVVAITYLSLVVGELVPKRIGLGNPESTAMALAGLMHGLSVAASPFVWFLGASTNALLWLLRVRPGTDGAISEEDIDMVIAQGRQAGVVEPAEQEIIENAFWLGERRVNAIMTPRHEVSWLEVGATRDRILELLREDPHSRYLVAEGDLDRVAGYVATSDLLAASLEGGPIELGQLVRKPLIVPETLPILELLEQYQATGTHLATVIDEYGGFEGLLTLSDLLEELVGKAVPPGFDGTAEVVPIDDHVWLVKGSLHIDELLDLLSLEDEADQSDRGYQTVGGLVAARLGRMPEAGDTFEWNGFELLVEEMDGLRVNQVRVTRIRRPGGTEAPEPEES